MAKKSNSVSKSLRIDQLRKVLARWGRLNKQQIDQYLSAHLNLDKDSVSRTLARDLEELERNHEVQKYYFTRDGHPIEEFDPEIHKNTYCEWTLVGSESQILGQDILKANGAKLLVSDRLSKVLKIESGDARIDLNGVHIFFNIPNHYLSLRIVKDALPVTVVVGRIPSGSTNSQEILGKLEDVFGKRVVMLSLPYASISSFKLEGGQLGHAVIHLAPASSIADSYLVAVSDLKAKNKTYYCKLSQIEADLVRKNGASSIDKTLTEGWGAIRKSDFNVKYSEVVGEVTLQNPSLIFCSEQIPLLIV